MASRYGAIAPSVGRVRLRRADPRLEDLPVGSSVLGLVAFVARIAALVTGGGGRLLLLVLTSVVLWAMSTMRHAAAQGPSGRVPRRPTPAA